MKIADFKVYRFQLDLKLPLPLGKQSLTVRNGLLIELHDANDNIAFGEVSPLPGFSREDIATARQELESLCRSVTGCDVPDHLEELSGGFERWVAHHRLSPSVRCGFEAAVLQLLAAGNGVPLSRLISDAPCNSVSVNSLLSGSRDEVMAKVNLSARRGYTSFKLKLGRGSIRDDIEITREVRQAIGGKAVLRLDANRSWSVDDALSFGMGIAGCKIDYIEEPVATVDLLHRLMCESNWTLPVALDESLVELEPRDLLSFEGLKAIVLKPTLLGFESAMQFAHTAAGRGIAPVVSSSYESGVGLVALAHLAACACTDDTAVGLGTLDNFVEDLLSDSLRIKGGRIEIATLPDIPSVMRRDLLKKVHHE